MVASEITPKEDIDVCIAGCIKSVRAGGGSGDIFTNSDLFVMHCDNLRYIVLQICITPDPGEYNNSDQILIKITFFCTNIVHAMTDNAVECNNGGGGM